MATDYYATFSPVHLVRSELCKPLTPLFKGRHSIESIADRLSYEHGRLSYDGGTARVTELGAALNTTSDWDGVEFHFVRDGRQWSLSIWSDIKHCSTVALCEPGASYQEQLNDQRARMKLLGLLLALMATLGASFCIVEAESTYRSRTKSEVEEWLRGLRNGDGPRDWVLVLCKTELISIDQIPVEYRSVDSFCQTDGGDCWILSFMGPIC